MPHQLTDAPNPDPSRALRYSTAHSFKGLEQDAVLVVDIDDLVSLQAVDALYVASSRARTDLFLYLSEDLRPQYEQRAIELGRRLGSDGETETST